MCALVFFFHIFMLGLLFVKRQLWLISSSSFLKKVPAEMLRRGIRYLIAARIARFNLLA
jgi:hypothetical protein